jgi:hypothetical protein
MKYGVRVPISDITLIQSFVEMDNQVQKTNRRHGDVISLHNFPNEESQSHITTDDLSVSASWFRAPSWAHDQILINV